MKSRTLLSSRYGTIKSSKIRLTFGAFMNLTVTVLIDQSTDAVKGLLAEYHHGKSREDAIQKALEKINLKLPSGAKVVDFEVGTYTTPVTRRTYAVGIVLYNAPPQVKSLEDYTIKERRKLLSDVLRKFNYNPRVLNISEVARTFGVSRDSIYYDIEQILKEKRTTP
ncbi:hypothetical protein [Thermococcus sp. P6]|uniref:hypothetical protein n=1 Tax=Thermococcus sp. P6 TaxID=122420 RepID=UPI001E37502F|nr:hypothetical protein [Thermococcus sp. P6]